MNDLAFTGCIDRGAQIPRASLRPAQEYGTGIVTDGDIAVLQLNGCGNPRMTPSDPQRPGSVRVVRALKVVGEDIVRSNPGSIVIATTKSLLDRHEMRTSERIQAARAFTAAQRGG